MAFVRPGTRTGGAAYYHARRRRRGHQDPAHGLFGTHSFVEADSGFDVGDSFADRTVPITFAVEVERTAASAQGIIVELGNSTAGLAIWILSGGTDIGACAGDAGDDGVTLTASSVLVADGQSARVVFSVVPSTGEARLWVDGELQARGASVNSPLPNGWSSDSAAGIGEVSGSATNRVPGGDKVSLANAVFVSPLRVYQGQKPRQFD